MISVPERLQYLLKKETQAFAFLALTLKDGSPQVTPIWFDWDGTHLILNTARGRVKDKVMKRKARVALCIVAPQDPYQYLQFRGTVASETEDGGYDMICSLNEKYHGDRNYPKRPGEVRVTYMIRPDQIFPKQ